MNDERTQRERTALLGQSFAPAGGGRPEEAAILAQTRTQAVYPGIAGAAYVMAPCQAEGGATEGAAYTLAVDPVRTFLAVNLGAAIPPEGTTVICHRVGGRWAFRFGG